MKNDSHSVKQRISDSTIAPIQSLSKYLEHADSLTKENTTSLAHSYSIEETDSSPKRDATTKSPALESELTTPPAPVQLQQTSDAPKGQESHTEVVTKTSASANPEESLKHEKQTHPPKEDMTKKSQEPQETEKVDAKEQEAPEIRDENGEYIEETNEEQYDYQEQYEEEENVASEEEQQELNDAQASIEQEGEYSQGEASVEDTPEVVQSVEAQETHQAEDSPQEEAQEDELIKESAEEVVSGEESAVNTSAENQLDVALSRSEPEHEAQESHSEEEVTTQETGEEVPKEETQELPAIHEERPVSREDVVSDVEGSITYDGPIDESRPATSAATEHSENEQ